MPKQTFKGIITLFALVLTFQTISAQLEDREWYYGFTAGVTQSSIQDIQTSLIRPIFPEGSYDARSQKRLGFTGGAFVHYRFKDSRFAIQPEIYYSDMGGRFHYEDISELTYDIDLKYSYLQINPNIKFYMMKGFHASLGPQLGLIINRSNLTYTSNQPEQGPDLQIQQSLREVLKGNSIVSVALGAGYDLPMGLSLNFKYVVGISDSMETLANGFYFIENKNSVSSMQLTVGYAIPFVN